MIKYGCFVDSSAPSLLRKSGPKTAITSFSTSIYFHQIYVKELSYPDINCHQAAGWMRVEPLETSEVSMKGSSENI
jgi:hypothetical protein